MATACGVLMLQTFRFCYGCNEKFESFGEEGACPHCGQVLTPLSSASTADLKSLIAREAYKAELEPEETGEDELVGGRLGTYAIEALAGRGGMARVYRATHLMLHRTCALKVLSPQLAARDPSYLDLFHAEARAAAALMHPHVVAVHNIGYGKDRHFIELEYIVGQSLRQMIHGQKPLDPLRATRLLLEACSGLAAAHHRGIIHRDLKPANILVREDDTAKLADFGLAKRVVSERPLARGNVAGTPYFMAPELFSGEPATTLSDVYAAGITYFYLLSGHLPYVHSGIHDLARLHAEEPVPEVSGLRSGVPAEIGKVLERCLAKRAEERYQDASALCDDLRAVLRSLRDMNTLLSEALDGEDLEWEGSDDAFVATVKLSDGRSQRVQIEASADGPLVERLVKIYSICAPMSDAYLRRALELNAKVPHGSVAIQRVRGEPYFVMVNTYPRTTCDPEEVRRSVLDIARWADSVEKALTDEDRH